MIEPIQVADPDPYRPVFMYELALVDALLYELALVDALFRAAQRRPRSEVLPSIERALARWTAKIEGAT